MPSPKTVAMTFRFTPEFKRQLEVAAKQEQRSYTNMLEKLLSDYCAANGVPVPDVLEAAAECDSNK